MAFDLSDRGPFELSHRLSKCEAQWRRWQRVGGAHPFGKEPFPGKTTYDQVDELHSSDPMRTPLLRWLHRLIEARITVPFEAHDRELERVELVTIVQPAALTLSRRELRLQMLRSEGEQLNAWIRSWARHEQVLSDHRIQTFLAYAEVSERLGVSDPWSHWNPIAGAEPGASAPCRPPSEADLSDPPPASPSPPLETVTALALGVLRNSNDAAEESIGSGFGPLIEALAGHDAAEGWPARLVPETLRELLRAPELFRALTVDPGELPSRLVPMSFPRAIAQIGGALSRSLAPRDLPLVVARDPDDLLGHFASSLFFLWSCSPVFVKRTFGLSGDRFTRTARGLSVALLASVRLAAARALLAEAALVSKGALLDQFAQTSTELLLGQELPPTAALARFSARRDEAARFSGLLWAAATVEQLVEEHDEDWFHNPRVQEWLRAELTRVAPTEVQLDVCHRGMQALQLAYSAML